MRGGGDRRSGHSVLVVDDDPFMRDIVSLWVRRCGHDVRDSEDSRQALKTLDQQPADVAVCDVNMPGENGVWLASQIRDRFPATAIIMATSSRDMDHVVSSLQNDVVDYLLKPFDGARLREALSLGVQWHRARAGGDDLHRALEDRLRNRRASVAATIAAVQATPGDALKGLIDILQLHERDGRGHATRVARLALSLADELDLDHNQAMGLEQGALLHDIGKLDLPMAILSKPAPLTDEEWQVMRTHPRIGYELVNKLPGFGHAAEIVLAHHEAFDGSGYPHGLKGRDIPVGARILSIADSFDSMTHPHIQRPAMPPRLAVSEIERCSGSQFDPEFVGVLGDLLRHVAEERVH